MDCSGDPVPVAAGSPAGLKVRDSHPMRQNLPGAGRRVRAAGAGGECVRRVLATDDTGPRMVTVVR